MRGTLILAVFFALFTCASLLIPSPMFPGNILSALIGGEIVQYSSYLSALINGIFYGGILWAAFVAISGRLEGKHQVRKV
jgi:hypothetical protein